MAISLSPTGTAITDTAAADTRLHAYPHAATTAAATVVNRSIVRPIVIIVIIIAGTMALAEPTTTTPSSIPTARPKTRPMPPTPAPPARAADTPAHAHASARAERVLDAVRTARVAHHARYRIQRRRDRGHHSRGARVRAQGLGAPVRVAEHGGRRQRADGRGTPGSAARVEPARAGGGAGLRVQRAEGEGAFGFQICWLLLSVTWYGV